MMVMMIAITPSLKASNRSFSKCLMPSRRQDRRCPTKQLPTAPGREAAASLPPDRALRIDIHRVERVARGHEQAVALDAAEAEVRAALGERDMADHRAVGGEHHDP